jgi:signal transduction histidine kinase
LDPASGEDAAPSGRSRAEPALSDEVTARRAQAWRADRIVRERISGLATVSLGACLVMVWGVLDYYLEPGWFRPFLLLRIGCTSVLLVSIALLWWARTLWLVRLAPIVGLVAIAVAVGIILSRVGDGFPFYVLGYSMAFWGSGALLSWPIACAVVTYLFYLATYAGAMLTYPDAHDASEVWGGFFYLASAAIIALTITAVRLRLERRAFDLGFSLGERNEELRQTLVELAAAQARLVQSEKQSALGRLLAGLSHELNNPVNVIANNLEPVRGYVDVLARVAAECTALRGSCAELDRALSAIASEEELGFVIADVRAAIDTIELGSERMRHVHGDLRAFIRGDSSTAVREDVSVGLRATVEMLRRGLRGGVRIEASFAELPPVRHEPGPLNQVFLNLIQNAIDSVGDSGVVMVASRADGEWVEIAVSDSGPGVSERALAHLFEPFFTTKPVRQGTGLGLAISKQIVERQGGHIELADPRTATFIVRLPVARA